MGDRHFFAFYEVDSPAVLNSQAYLQRLENPTPWTQRTMKSLPAAWCAPSAISRRSPAI